MRAAYDAIYFELKELVEDGAYPYRSFLPSESTLVKRYGCAHNTVRKALAALASDGYVQPIHGKGVRVIYQGLSDSRKRLFSYSPSELQSFSEALSQHDVEVKTEVLLMEPLTIDDELAQLTHFEKGDEVVHFERVHYCDGHALERESNYFLESTVSGITKHDAEHSIYRYIENVRGGKFVTGKRRVTVERATERDLELLELGDANYLPVIRIITFDGDGLLCEFSEIRHQPDTFSLSQVLIRSRLSQ